MLRAQRPFNIALPVVDTRIVVEDPRTVFARDEAVSVPLIIGSNAKEIPFFPDIDAAREAVRGAFGEQANAALTFYRLDETAPPPADPRLGDVAIQAATDLYFRCPNVSLAKSAARAGLPVWQYEFDHQAPNGNPVSHASEIAYVFGVDQTDLDQAPMTAYWTNFAKTGDPNGEGLPEWPAYDLGDRAYLAFAQDGPHADTRLREPLCDWLVGP